MNTKRSFKDKYDYCNLNLYLNSEGNVLYNLSPFWVQGFLDGEATFYIHLAPVQSQLEDYINVNKEEAINDSICNPSLEVAQNSHDVAILLALKNFFKGGYLKPKYNVNSLEECLHSRSVNRFIFRAPIETIVEFISSYPLKTRKMLDYQLWNEIINLKKQKAHKTISGLSSMWEIKNRMNSNRN